MRRPFRAAVPLVLVLFTWSLTTHGKYSASGDEPHYLMIAESLVSDGDLDVANNYARNDGRLFGHDHLEMGGHAVPSRTGRVLPVHDIGLEVALVPVYAFAREVAGLSSPQLLARSRMDRGLFTYSIIGLFLIALTAAGFTLLALGFGGGKRPARTVALLIAAGISPPVVSHAFLVFPEVIALFATSVVVWFARKEGEGPRDTTILLGILLMLGALPWTHHKYLLVPLVLLYLPAAAFVEWWGGFAPAARYIAPAVPLLLVPMIDALASAPVRLAAVALAVPQLAIDAVIWQHPRWLWPAPEGNLALRALVRFTSRRAASA